MNARLSVAVLLLSLALVKLDVVGLVRFVVAVRGRFGTAPALLFACVMRANWLDAHAGAPASYVFRGGDDVGLIFLPGATVEPAAYAPLLKRVAEEARATVLLGRPAFRSPVLFGGAKAFRALAAGYPGVRTWAVGGHSMGAGSLGAAGIAADPTSGARGLAMLAGVPTGSALCPVDLSDRPDLESLAVFGSEDTIVSLADGAKAEDGSLIRDNLKRLPPRTRREVIRGGNHAGFGLYGPQTFPVRDGVRTISLEDQQSQTARHLVSFLRRVARRQK